MEISVVFNSKLACSGVQGVMNAIRRMQEANSMKVAARVHYLNEDGTISKRVKPCYVVINKYENPCNPTIIIYGENKLANTLYFSLHQELLNPKYGLDIRREKDAEAGKTDMYYYCTIY